MTSQTTSNVHIEPLRKITRQPGVRGTINYGTEELAEQIAVWTGALARTPSATKQQAYRESIATAQRELARR
jgi:hypothetical protein